MARTSNTRYVAQAGVIAAVYAAFTLLVLQLPAGLGWGPVQLRVSEAVTVLALFTPAAIPGLTLGSVLANSYMVALTGPVAVLDVVFGSLGTFLGAWWTWRLRSRPRLALAGPVVTNALIVPAYLPILARTLGFADQFYQLPWGAHVSLTGSYPAMYAFGLVTVGIGQAIVLYGLGWPLSAALRRLGLDRMLERPEETGE